MAILPDFRAARFTAGAPIDNPYLPLARGTVLTYAGWPPEAGGPAAAVESDDLYVTFASREVLGVQTVVVRDTAYADGRMVEDTLDFFAQDTAGNVWYFGELSYEFEYASDGSFEGADSEGSWLAGKGGALPGQVMPAEPGFGAAFYQEFAPGVAEDEAIVVARGGELTTAFGRFTDLLTTLDTSALEPAAAEFKHYAPGVGLVRAEEELDALGEPALLLDLVAVREVEAPGEADGTERASSRELKRAVGARTVTVTLEGGEGELENALGAYTYDLATGRIGEGRVLFASDDATAPGTSVELEIEAGQGLGLFLLADATGSGLDLAEFEEGGLHFRNFLTGGRATIDDLLAPLVVDAPGRKGEPLPLQPLHATGDRGGFNDLDPVAGLQARIDGDRIGFEERRVTDPLRDGDFDDVLVRVDEPAAAALAALGLGSWGDPSAS
jgi:hypothetical protein